MEKLYTNDLNSHLYPETPNLVDNTNNNEKPQSAQGFDLKMLLPLLQGGSFDSSSLMKMFGKSLPPQMSQVMALMNNPQSKNQKKPRAPAPDFIPVEEYYKNN